MSTQTITTTGRCIHGVSWDRRCIQCTSLTTVDLRRQHGRWSHEFGASDVGVALADQLVATIANDNTKTCSSHSPIEAHALFDDVYDGQPCQRCISCGTFFH